VIEGATEYSTGMADDVVGLKAVDDYTVEIQLVRPYPSFLEVLAMVDVSIVPRSAVEADAVDFGRSPIGTGPFRMAQWTDEQLRLEANPDYFGGVPLLNGLVIHFPGDSRSADGDRLVSGQIDVIEPGGEMMSRLQNEPAVRIFRYQELSLLEEAGYPDGEALAPIELWAPQSSSSVREVIDGIRTDLQEVGIQLVVRDVTWAELEVGLSSGDAPAFLLGWVADLTDPDAFMHTMFKSGAAGNYFAYDDERTDKMLTLGARGTNSIKRARLYRQLEFHVLNNAPIVPLYHTRGVVAMRYEVAGLAPGPMGLANVDFERVWFRSRRTPS
jgi:ABC-type transport system substrate-binding protein